MNRFFRLIWPLDPDLFGEIRSIQNGRIKQHFKPLTPDGIDALVALATTDNDLGMDVYYGVLPRTRPEGTADAVVPYTHVLWSDIDAKLHSKDLIEGKSIALAKAMSVVPEPQVVVDSGGGTHAYWLLREPIDYVDARDIMAGIAKAIGGDHVQDAPRVLRVPGTFNFKREPELYCRVLRMVEDGPKYRASDFASYIRQPKKVYHDGVFPRMDELPAWLTDLILQGAPVGSRSEQVFKAVIGLVRFGRTDSEIFNFIRNTPDGIGSKFAEMSELQAERWLERTIRKARELA